MATTEEWKFLEELVFASASRKEALVGRGAGKVYKTGTSSKQKWAVQFEIEGALLDISARYPNNGTDDKTAEKKENDHVENIVELAGRVSREVGKYLVGDGLTVGRAQKALNLHLKYLWCAGRKLEPPHCPFDDNVIKKLNKLKKLPSGFDSWTAIADKGKYCDLVKEARARVRDESLAVWELREWNSFALQPSKLYWASKLAHTPENTTAA